MSALSKIKNAGFEVTLFGDSFRVSPSSELTNQQREFLKSHKAEIVNELQDAEVRAKNTTDEILCKLVKCYSPSGLCYEIEAISTDNAEWLRRMNPNPITQENKISLGGAEGSPHCTDETAGK